MISIAIKVSGATYIIRKDDRQESKKKGTIRRQSLSSIIKRDYFA